MRASNRIIRLDDIIEVCRMQCKVFEASRELQLSASQSAKSLLVSGAMVQTIATPQLVLPNRAIMFDIVNRSTNSSQKVTAAISWAEPDNIPGLTIKDSQFVSYNGVYL